VLTRISVENFKSFAQRQEAHLSKITLIYGPNSAGKSSLIQALLLLVQTMESSERDHLARLATRGSYVDLGSFLATVHAHDVSNDISLEIHCNPLTFHEDRYKHLNISEIGAQMTFSWDPESRAAIYRATTLFSDSDELHFDVHNAENMTFVAYPHWSHSLPWVFEIVDQRFTRPVYFASDDLVPGQIAFQNPPYTFESVLDITDEDRPNIYPIQEGIPTDFDGLLAYADELNAKLARQEFERIYSVHRHILDRYPWLATGASIDKVLPRSA
jgi:hypothetical protein